MVDDYAHHPTEIEATLNATLKINHRKVWCIFQPHTYTRTLSLMDDFARTLSKADTVIVTDIYAAREKDTGKVHSRDLAEKIDNSIYIKEFSDIAEYIKANAKEGDIVLTMGAGNVCDISKLII